MQRLKPLSRTLVAVVVVPVLAGQDPRKEEPNPAVLNALLARANVVEPVQASCRGEIRVGHPGEFAAALGTDRAGRYALVQDDGVVTELAGYEGPPALTCYTLREADKLTADIARSDTINGRVTAEWDGLVVCGAIEAAITVCWQHAIERKGFVRVGGWTR
jgi:hypothetical protein